MINSVTSLPSISSTQTLIPQPVQLLPLIIPKFYPRASISRQCTETDPCIGPDQTKPYWDTDPSNPDYYVLTVSVGEIGKSITPIAGSLMVGWVNDPSDNEYPTYAEMEDFLLGFGVNGGVGVIGGGGVNWSPNRKNSARCISCEYGVVLIAQLGVSINYSGRVMQLH